MLVSLLVPMFASLPGNLLTAGNQENNKLQILTLPDCCQAGLLKRGFRVGV